MHWCSWRDLCILKNNGGTGFKDLAKFNIAMLVKHGWRILMNPNSLMARVLCAKYFCNSDFLKARLGNQPSLVWCSIWSAQGLLEKGELSHDRLVWSWDNTGFYTVKSGYMLFQSNNCKEIQPTDKTLYNNIWQLQFVLVVVWGWRMSSTLSVPVHLCITFLGSWISPRMQLRSNTGSVIRNGKGPVFGTCVVLNVNVSTPFAEEALACLQSMAFARHLRLDKMVVEGDSLTVIKKALSN
ncbi:hypothetical protein PVK06_024087 [Gossypium arboreum]|uniref:RNase H type-1 domain-containing protein n=1 Tax=Gossypium arboreum TaxID=29729 RepID=A0ABR0PCV0_GOSAR|nr:hypothetical protein PVK06_024087 [Gossypium arboreum]